MARTNLLQQYDGAIRDRVQKARMAARFEKILKGDRCDDDDGWDDDDGGDSVRDNATDNELGIDPDMPLREALELIAGRLQQRRERKEKMERPSTRSTPIRHRRVTANSGRRSRSARLSTS